MRKQHFICTIVAIAAMLFLTSTTFATCVYPNWNAEPLRSKDSGSITVKIDSQFTPAERNVIKTALGAWNTSVSNCTGFTYNVTNVTYHSSEPTPAANVIWIYHTPSGGGGTYTMPEPDYGKIRVGNDVAGFGCAADCPEKLAALAEHEIGHDLGLANTSAAQTKTVMIASPFSQLNRITYCDAAVVNSRYCALPEEPGGC